MRRIGSLCSGYGGLDLAVQSVVGGELAWVADNDPGAAKILAHRYPDVPNLGDITAANWTTAAPVDVLTAGFPCQDISLAGKRAGLRKGTRSGIWAQVAEAIGVLRPSLVVLENVRSLTSAEADSDVEPCPWCMGDGGDQPVLRALGAVLGDLADLGFDAEWVCVGADDAGAPHRRKRIFITARPAEDADRAASGELWLSAPGQAQVGGAWADARGRGGAPAAHTDRDPVRQQPEPVDGRGGQAVAGLDGFDWSATPYADAIARWESVLGRLAPRPTEPGRTRERLSPRFVEWMMGLPEGWVTDVPGLTRNAQLKALGNGVVPQQCALALRLLLARTEPAATAFANAAIGQGD